MNVKESMKHTNSQGTKIVTNYEDAVNYLHNDFILCNEIPSIDDTVYDNMRFNNEYEDGTNIEIYQWFLTNASLGDVEYLKNRFDLLFTYSDNLDPYVLCVPHYGTSWDYVECQDNEANK